jgi:hypothetical protein
MGCALRLFIAQVGAARITPSAWLALFLVVLSELLSLLDERLGRLPYASQTLEKHMPVNFEML